MPFHDAAKGLRLTLGCVCANQRWQCVIPYLTDADLVARESAFLLRDFWQTNIFPLWQLCFAEDCYIDGILIESMTPGRIVPARKIYAPTAFPGSEGSESYSPNASMLVSWYSPDQAQGSDIRMHVAKNFIGPPPESKCAADSVDLAFCGDEVFNFIDHQKTCAVGGGVSFYRAMRSSKNPAQNIYTADVFRVRSTVFTQKRRVRPVL